MNGEPIEVVSEYRYLGLTIRSDLSWGSVFTDIMSKVKSRVAQLHFLFTRRDLTIATRLSLYKALVLPLFTYGAGVWWLTEKQTQQLERVQLRVLKAMLGTHRSTTTVAVLAETGIPRLRDLIDVRKLQFAGKLESISQDRLVGKMCGLVWRIPAKGFILGVALYCCTFTIEVEAEFIDLREGRLSLAGRKRAVNAGWSPCA